MTEADVSTTDTGARPWLRVLGLSFVALALFAGGGLATCSYFALGLAKQAGTQTTTVLRGTSTVIVAVRDLAVLQTTSYHMERVIDLRDRQSHLFGLFESQDALLLVAAADVVAGVDLGLMREGDIRIDTAKRSAYLRLPRPEILSVRLDNQNTYVHTRKTDTLAVRAQTLETRARQEAERELEQAALSTGILRRAQDNAARTVKSLVQSLGFEQVTVEFLTE
jgi:DNA-binding LytR/AlgR family response regulator